MYITSITLDGKPASVEFTDKRSLEAIVTTYDLDSENTYRGSIYKLQRDKIVKQVDLPGGVFRFTRQYEGHIVTTLTTGSAVIVDNDLNIVKSLPVTKKGALLSVSVQGNSALCSDAYGELHIVNLETGKISSFVGHISPYTKKSCEVWTTLWLDANCAISGGEDNLVKLWDFRMSNGKQLIGVNRMHQFGVISLHNEGLHYIISGSYDDFVRRIDLRSFSKTVVSKKLYGGVWSVRPADQKSYVVSCMYGGWALIEKENFEILQTNQKLGENLLYGADFSPQASVIVSCTSSLVGQQSKQRLKQEKRELAS